MNDSTKAIFLSYTAQDAEAAKRLSDALRSAGIETWFDQSELRGGDAWDAAIRRQIKACALFLPVLSRNSHERAEGYFRLEWKLAVDRSHLMAADRPFLLPIVVDDLDEPTARSGRSGACRSRRRPWRSPPRARRGEDSGSGSLRSRSSPWLPRASC